MLKMKNACLLSIVIDEFELFFLKFCFPHFQRKKTNPNFLYKKIPCLVKKSVIKQEFIFFNKFRIWVSSSPQQEFILQT